MKKRYVLLVVFILLVNSGVVFAEELEEQEKNNVLNVYRVDDNYSAGLKLPIQELDNDFFATLNLEYREEKGAVIETGAVYMIPDILIWDFYGGGGVGIDSKDRSPDAYFVLGSQFLFFFNEARYSLREDELRNISGFKFRF